MKKEAKWFIKWVKWNYPDYFQAFCEHGHKDFDKFLDSNSPRTYISSAFVWDAPNGVLSRKYWSEASEKWNDYLEQKQEEERQRIINELDEGISKLSAMFCSGTLDGDSIEIGFPISGKTVSRIIINLKKDDK